MSRPETNGPLAAQEYRSRNPQIAPQKPHGLLKENVLREMWCGRATVRMVQFEKTMPPDDLRRFKEWSEVWYG